MIETLNRKSIDFGAIRCDNPLPDMAAAFVPGLKRKGSEWSGCCPFHDEKTASFTIYSGAERFQCFGCGAQGDVIDFVAAIDGCSVTDAARKLAGQELRTLSAADRAANEAMRAEREAESAAAHKAGTAKALARWEAATPANDSNAYLERKKVKPHCARIEGGSLLLEINDSNGELQSVQTITPDGAKRFAKGAPTRGGRLLLGSGNAGLILCEGFATGASIHEATDRPVCIGFSSAGVKALAREFSAEGLEFVIAADRTGLDGIEKLSNEIGVSVFLPAEPHDDFNDLAVANGANAVRSILDGEPKSQSNFGVENDDGVNLNDFQAYMPAHSYIFAPTGEHWPASSVNARIKPIPLTNTAGLPMLDKKGERVEQKPNAWLDENRAVEQVTWIPGKPQVIADKIVSDGGWIDRLGCNVFNLYRPPQELNGDASLASPWIDHVRKVYPDDADHLICWFAHRVQRPDEKINHAIVLGGSQGVGKDTMIEPVKAAVGPWNVAEVSPQHLLGRFNGFVKSVIMRVSEARDLGDVDRFAFYDHMKTYTAAPPDVLRVDEKHLREYSVFNVTGTIITSNHKTDGIYLPSDDRRHYVAWSNCCREDFQDDYWRELYGWYENGGIGHVATYLRELDLSDFDPKAPPPKTSAFWEIVSSNQAPEDAELADALDSLCWPDALTIASISAAASQEFSEWLGDRRNSRRTPHRLEQCGYVPVRNDSAKDGHFKVNGKRCRIYARNNLSVRDQSIAAKRVCRR
ncbi:MAG: CHC2 zinc finger domain-containing protein [Erythrobacter sp.]